jgi:two-component system, OmpR family, sensor kinase
VRRRLSLTMAAMVVGALVFAGLATLGLTDLNSVQQAQSELVTEAKQLAQGVDEVDEAATTGKHHDSLAVLRSTLEVLKAPLQLQGEAIVGVSPNGSFYNPLDANERIGADTSVTLPGSLSVSDVETPQLLIQDQPVSGHRGRMAWAAVLVPQPVPISASQSINLVVVLTRNAAAGVGAAALWFAIASAATIVIALIAANRLGHRIARPLQQTEGVTRRIATGDLEARVPVPEREGPELVSLANSVNQMAASLAKAKGAQRQFLMSVSHDLRTPLTSVRGFAEALSDGTTDDVEYAAGVISSEARRLERLVTDLLDLAKLESGAFSLHCGPVDLSKVVTEATRAFAPAASDQSLSISLETAPPGEILCDADPDRLAQVVANVVENALKYAKTRVTVKTGQFERDRPTVLVEDDGPGIPPEDLERVFERLYQSRLPADRKVSSGLGLAIVDELVKRMGGEVRAESPIGPAGGTRFVIMLQGVVRKASGVRQTTAIPTTAIPSTGAPSTGAPSTGAAPTPAPAPTDGSVSSWPGVPASKS